MSCQKDLEFCAKKPHAAEEALFGKRLHIVDDEPDSLRILEAKLDRKGAEIKAFSDPMEGFSETLRHPPDLLLLDVMMPGMDGWSFYTRLRSNRTLLKLPVLFVTCIADHRIESEMQQGKLCATLPKPVVTEELFEKIALLLT